MSIIQISPSGRLSLSKNEAQELDALSAAFSRNWCEGLFCLAAKRDFWPAYPELKFWEYLASSYLTRLCHTPPEHSEPDIKPPSKTELESMLDTAPPMRGGEYLTIDLLLVVWNSLAGWVESHIVSNGGIRLFLQNYAPDWNMVGRVTFHLAENKNDANRPFAFMVSFSTSLGADGQVRHLPLRKALEMYTGAGDKSALIKLLSPIYKAASRCDWVQNMVTNGEIYRPMAWTPGKAYALLRSIPQLKDSGLMVRVPDWWQKRPRPKVNATIGEKQKSFLGIETLLDFNVTLTLDGESLSEEQLRELLAQDENLILFKGKWVEVDREKLNQALDHWKKLEQTAQDGGISFIEGMRLLAGTGTDLSGVRTQEEECENWVQVQAGKSLKSLLHGLRQPADPEDSELTRGVQATLRPYQRQGVNWLHFVSSLGLGACLADDMGLGKTVQVLTLLTYLARQNNQRSLLIVPASLLGNWRAEAQKFTPQLKLFFAHPSQTPKKDLQRVFDNPQDVLRGYDLVVTTYALVIRMEWLKEQNWHLVILDESQAIKNHTTKQSKAVRQIPARSRIALTGTPVENHLSDVWSLFDFLNPGLLGTPSKFKSFVKNMHDKAGSYAPLRKLISPYILRRLKTDKSVIADLPDKTEIIHFCALSKKQIKLYQQVVEGMKQALSQDMKAMNRRGLVLQSMMRLKQICNHPAQFVGDGDYDPRQSGKFVRLKEIALELAERQEKMLVFTQFKEIIPALHDHLEGIFGQSGLVLHGGTAVKKRKNLVEQFQKEDGPPFFILSLKAGGTGLNLTAACHVVHFDRWWNPAVENQATDRSFRIGQTKNVLVHKFVTSGTIEEKIDEMINSKQKLATDLLSGSGELRLTELGDEELVNLVSLDIDRASF
ncbi:MAG: DEAD/DEAH box helicase [Desulfoplanes sp.]